MAVQDLPDAGSGSSVRHAAIVSCWLCGSSLHSNRMVPDGGDACDDVRWYCTDVLSCTHRWITQARHWRAGGGLTERDQQAGEPASQGGPGADGA